MKIESLYNLDEETVLETLKISFSSKEDLMVFLNNNDVPYKKQYGYNRLLNETVKFIIGVSLYRRIAKSK